MFLTLKEVTKDFFNCCNDVNRNKVCIAQIGSIVEYSYHSGWFICANGVILQFDSVGILVWYISDNDQIFIITRIDRIIATNSANLMIVVSLKRGESDLSIRGIIVNFGEFDANV